jgi:molecular chaperone GrpE
MCHSVIKKYFGKIVEGYISLKNLRKAMTNEQQTAEEINEEMVNEVESTETATATEAAHEETTENSVENELAELKDKYLRLYADFENFRRRTAKEKLDLISTGNAELMKVVLPVLDDFERAMAAFEVTTEVEPIKEGIGLIYNKLFKNLESRGLKSMTTKGEVFDADLHESITQFPAPSEDLKGKVIDEVEKGYLLNEKVIRYAKVVVGC